jgi:hypothetical protein
MYKPGGTIAEPLGRTQNKSYILPAIQREFVWKPEQIERLFDSLMQGYPELEKWLGYRQADRRDGNPLTNDDRKRFVKSSSASQRFWRSAPRLDERYKLAAAHAFKAAELGIKC